MQPEHLFDYLPLWGLFAVTVLVVLVSVEGGFRLGRRRRRSPEHEQEAPVGSIIGATLGLLAFIMAFTFGLAASRFDTRKQLVLDESNAIGTAYLRADLLPEPHRAEIRSLLRDYVDARVPKGDLTSEKIAQAIVRSEQLQNELWSEAASLGRVNTASIVVGLFIQSLNDVIDLHSKRVTAGLYNRIPPIVWVVLYFVTVLAMAGIGYQLGLSGTRSLIAVFALVLTFSGVMMLITDLDRPQQGLIKVSQRAMIDLQKQMTEPEH